MKYKPRNSNFDEAHDEIVSEIIRAQEAEEQIKDKIAELIDEYVDAIMEENLKERSFLIWTNEQGKLAAAFWLGTTTRKNQAVEDCFSAEEPLENLLKDFEFDYANEAIAAAEMFDRAAAECREAANDAPYKNREEEQEYLRKHPELAD